MAQISEATFLFSLDNTYADSAGNHTLEASGTPPAFTDAISKWGGYSMDTASGWPLLTDHEDIEPEGEDFTWEIFLYPKAQTRMSIFFGLSWYWMGFEFHFNGTRNINWYASDNGSSWSIFGPPWSATGLISIPLNTWSHIAFTRQGNSWRSFVNGVKDIELTNSKSIVNLAENKTLGKSIYFGGNFNWNDWRWVKGRALYTSDFEVPTSPLTVALPVNSVTNWNIQENINWYVLIGDSGTNNYVELYDNLSDAQHRTSPIATGSMEYDTETEITLTATSGNSIDLFQSEYDWHLKATGVAGEGTVSLIRPFTDLDTITNSIYRNSDLITYKASSIIDEHTHAILHRNVSLGTHIPDIIVGDTANLNSTLRSISENHQVLAHNIEGSIMGAEVSLISTVELASYLEINKQ